MRTLNERFAQYLKNELPLLNIEAYKYLPNSDQETVLVLIAEHAFAPEQGGFDEVEIHCIASSPNQNNAKNLAYDIALKDGKNRRATNLLMPDPKLAGDLECSFSVGRIINNGYNHKLFEYIITFRIKTTWKA